MSVDFRVDPEREMDRDEYWEAVGELVDGIVADIVSKHLRTKAEALRQLRGSVASSAYSLDCKPGDIRNHPAICLEHSGFPTLGFLQANHFHPDWARGTTPFPFAKLAQVAMTRDCEVRLHAEKEFKELQGC